MRVLITRAEPDASTTAALAGAYGLTPVPAPVMKIQIKTASVGLEGVGALAFTSANGVRAFAANSDARGLPVYAVGAITAKAAEAEGFKNISVAGGDVESLADCIAAGKAEITKSLLHIAGEDRAGDLVAALEARGVKAKGLALYKARAVAALPADVVAMLQADPPEWASFFSPRTVRLFLSLAEDAGVMEQLSKMRAACFSKAVADAAGDHWREIHVAPEPKAARLFAMIAEVGAQRA